MKILVINAGSSSLKFQLIDMEKWTDEDWTEFDLVRVCAPCYE